MLTKVKPTAAIIVVAVYTALQLISNIASTKIGMIGTFAIDMGTFLYPLTFTMRDVAHKILGKAHVRIMILVAALLNLAMVLYLWFCTLFPADPSWPLNEEFSAVLGPVSRIVVASILAQLIAELADTEAYHWFVTKITKRFQWARVLVSNAISVPLDSVVFVLIAFAPITLFGSQGLEWSIVWSIFWTNIIFKGIVTLASMPMIYVTPDRDWDSDKSDA
jgi:uncharacterized integral membrane protein (TIGR00697 family)